MVRRGPQAVGLAQRGARLVLRRIALKDQSVEVAAPRELVYEVVSSAGKKVGETDLGHLVEFETRWRDRVIKTVEEIQLDAPREIRYRWVDGPLDDVEEVIRFGDVDGERTTMTYSGRLGAGRGLVGWLRTALVVRPVFNRLVREHLEDGRRIAEKRAARSHVHRTGGGGRS